MSVDAEADGDWLRGGSLENTVQPNFEVGDGCFGDRVLGIELHDSIRIG